MDSSESRAAAYPRSAVDDVSSFSEHGKRQAWKAKAGRFMKPWKGSKRDANASINMGMAGIGNRNNNGTTAPSASRNSSRSSRRRRYLDGWVRYPKNSSSTSSSSTTSTSTQAPPSKVKDAYRVALKDRFVRKHLVICGITGVVLLMLISLCTPPFLISANYKLTLSTDLVYAISFTTLEGQTYHIFFILLIMIFAMVFCHSFARTCLLATKIARYGSTDLHRVPSVVGPLGYAQPAQPIHVVLARDEEIVNEGVASDGSTASTAAATAATATKVTAPPPAYGLWRSSVVRSPPFTHSIVPTDTCIQRLNPNLLYWQRVDSAPIPETIPEAPHSQPSTSTSESSSQPSSSSSSSSVSLATSTTASTQPRPPSYASDDGVGYVVEAQPRLTISHYSPASSVAKHG